MTFTPTMASVEPKTTAPRSSKHCRPYKKATPSQSQTWTVSDDPQRTCLTSPPTCANDESTCACST